MQPLKDLLLVHILRHEAKSWKVSAKWLSVLGYLTRYFKSVFIASHG